MRRFLGLAVMLLVLAPMVRAQEEAPATDPAPSSGSALDAEAAAIDAPSNGPAVQLAEPVAVGRLTLSPTGGTVRLLLCGETPCGLRFGGAGVRYVVDDPISRPVAERNFKTADGGELTTERRAGVATWTADEVVLWTWSPPVEIPADPAPTGAGGALPGWLEEVTGSRVMPPPSSALLAAAGDGNRRLAVVAWRSGRQTFLATYDPEVDREEVLYVLDRVTSPGSVLNGVTYRHVLAAQPVGRAWWEHGFAPLVALSADLDVDATGDEKWHGTVRSTTRLEATRATDLWRVDLDSFRYEDNKEYANRVLEVTVAGVPVPWRHHSDELLVRLPKTLQPREQVEVSVHYEGPIAIEYGGYDFWYLGTWAWYPQPWWNGELCRFRITVRVPEEEVPFASGVTVSQTTEEGVTTLVSELKDPMQYPVVAAGKYRVTSETRDGLTCRVATYGDSPKVGVERMITNFFAAVEFYELLFDVPYPVREVTIVERNSWGFGQAPPGIIFITREAFESISSETRQLFSQGVNERFVHEVAHGWWGQVAKKNALEEQWISEAFAEYSAALCLEAMKGGKQGRRLFDSMTKYWNGRVRNDAGQGESLYLANHLAWKSDQDEFARWELMYARGPLVLHALRLELRKAYGDDDMGDQVFFTWMRSVLANFSFKYAETRHLIGILNQITGSDWAPWFEKYVFGTEVPKV